MALVHKKRSHVFFVGGVVLAVAVALALLLLPFGGEAWRTVYRRLGLRAAPPEGLTVSVLDVGQGSALCLAGRGQVCLIDCGGAASGDAVADEIRALGCDHVDLLLVTHPHEDHIGGLPALMRRLPVKRVALPDWAPAGAEDAAAYRALCDADSERLIVRQGDVFTLGGFTVEALFAQDAAEENDRSVVYRVTAGERTLLVTGDLSREGEWRMLAAGKAVACDWLVAGHHGSADATSQELIDAAHPTLALISCGADNAYGHPAEQTLARLHASGVGTLRTDANGTIRLYISDASAHPRYGQPAF